MKIHELAKKYKVTTDELIRLLANAGYDVDDRASGVDFDMLNALERHFNWSAPTKKKAKAKAKTKTATKTKTKAKVKAKTKAKAKLVRRERPEKETQETPAAEVETKVKVKAKGKAKLVAKVKPAAKADAEGVVKAEPKAKTKTKAKAKAEAKTKTKAKTKTASKAKDEATTAAKIEREVAEKTPAKQKEEKKELPKAPEEKAARASTAVAVDPATRASAKPKEKGKTPSGKTPPVQPRKKEKRPVTHKPSRGKKTPLEQDAQRKAVRESVKRTLAKLETTRKTKRRKPKLVEVSAANLAPVQVQDKSTVAFLARMMGIGTDDILACCDEIGLTTTPDEELERDAIELIADALGRTVEIESVYGETRLKEEAQIDPAKLKPRSPIVTVMGHVDHGKTSILDHIRQTKVVEGEAGGITQHIGAYEVKTPDGNISFIDTPGHEAFTAMRARGARLTDIVVLVVAADDGVMPQTIEAINHTKVSGVPMVVAVNKIDLPGVDPMTVKQQLTQHDVVVEDFGGEVVGVEVSAKTGQGIDKLLEMILLQAEVLELKADPTSRAQGVVVEVRKEEGRGILCTVLVQQGTLRVGDVFVIGNEYGKVRSLVDYNGKRVKKALPSEPVQILGCNGLPVAGDGFIVVKNDREAREISVKRQETLRYKDIQTVKPMTLEDLYSQIQSGELKELNIIVKADADGSVEALRDSLSPLMVEDVSVKILHSAVGTVSESDVLLAEGSNSIIIAFNTNISPKAKDLAKRKGVDVRGYNVIYEAIEDVDDAMKGMLEPVFVERVLGKAEIRKVFRVSKLGTIAGSMVVQGIIPRNANARVHRDDEMVFEGKISSLKRFKDDVKEVAENFECGIGLSGYNDLQENDVIEAFVVEEKVRVFT